MKTAVQLGASAGDERPRAEILFGTPRDLGGGTLGPDTQCALRRHWNRLLGGRLPAAARRVDWTGSGCVAAIDGTCAR